MRVFLTSLCILFPLLLMSSPGVALDDDGKNVGLRVNREVAHGANDTTTADSWASILTPFRVIESIQNTSFPLVLRLTNAISKPLPSDFWEEAKKSEKTLQEYVPRLLKSAAKYFKSTNFTDITSTMDDIVRTTATFRVTIQSVLDAHHVTLDALTQELETIFIAIVEDLKKTTHYNKTPGHTEREEMVDKILNDTEVAVTNLTTCYGIDEHVTTTYLLALRPQVHALVATVGVIIEQHPQLLPILAFSVVGMFIPESWILRPFLGSFGFGPAGPLEGSAAAWSQSYFWGGAVESDSWFSLLQAAGMGKIPKWAGLGVKVPLTIGGGLLALLSCCG